MTPTGYFLGSVAVLIAFFVGGAVFLWNNRYDVDAAYKEGRRDGKAEASADAVRKWSES